MPERIPEDKREQFLAMGKEILNEVFGESADPVEITLSRRQTIILKEGNPVKREDEQENSPTQKNILAVLTRTPQPAKAIAKKAETKYSSYFRDQLGELVDQGKVLHVTSGYRLPAKTGDK